MLGRHQGNLLTGKGRQSSTVLPVLRRPSQHIFQYENSQSQSHPLGFNLGGSTFDVGFPVVGRKAR